MSNQTQFVHVRFKLGKLCYGSQIEQIYMVQHIFSSLALSLREAT